MELTFLKPWPIKQEKQLINLIVNSKMFGDCWTTLFPLQNVKVQKYNRAKWVSNFLFCGAKNLVEHYGKRIEILLRISLNWPEPVRSALKRTNAKDFSPIMLYVVLT